jgi:hypothetical protein
MTISRSVAVCSRTGALVAKCLPACSGKSPANGREVYHHKRALLRV